MGVSNGWLFGGWVDGSIPNGRDGSLEGLGLQIGSWPNPQLGCKTSELCLKCQYDYLTAPHQVGASPISNSLSNCLRQKFWCDQAFVHASIYEIPRLWNRHWGFATTNGSCVVLCSSWRVCVFQWLYCLKKRLKLFLCLWPVMLLECQFMMYAVDGVLFLHRQGKFSA